jgi:hypothetical protein
LDAFVLAPRELAFGGARLVDEAAAQSVSRWAALAVAKLNQTALPREYLDG